MRLLFFVACCLWSSIAAGADLGSGNEVLPGCKAFIASDKLTFPMGYCAGVVKTLMTVADDLSPENRLCIPDRATTVQIVRVVVNWLDARPEAHHFQFVDLAMEAIKQSWPCAR